MSPLRVAVLSEIELGSHKAHAINVVKTAGGFARLGHDVTLYALRARDPRAAEDAAIYAEPDLRVRFVPEHVYANTTNDDDRARRIGTWAAHDAATHGADLVYARHFHAALAAADRGLPTILETHAHIGDDRPIVSAAFAATARRGDPLRGIVTISPRLRDHYVQRGARATRVAIVPDGVDVEMFAPPLAPPPLPPGEVSRVFERRRGHALYAGHLYDYKGIPTILDAATHRPSITWHLVGGEPTDRTRVAAEIERRALTNIVLHGLHPYRDVPGFLWNADVLLLPPEATHPSAAWTSPVKLGEYLASERPIVANDIPGLRTWVDAPLVRWFRAGDALDLARAVDAALAESPDDRTDRVERARAAAARFSYTQRARKILALAGVSSPMLAAA